MTRMLARLACTVAVLVLPMMAKAQAKPDAGGQTLVVKMKYRGKGTVDDKHKIYRMVVDSDPYAAEVLADATSDKPVDPAQAQGKKIAYILQRHTASTQEQDVTFTGLKNACICDCVL